MPARRILYGLALTGTFLLQVVSDFYLSYLLLLLLILLPLLSLLISLPVILRCRLQISALPVSVQRGFGACWQIRAEGRFPLPTPAIRLKIEVANLLTGETARNKLVLRHEGGNETETVSASSEHCGMLELQIKKARVCDYLGLFAFPIPKPDAARLLVEPVPLYPGELNLPESHASAAASSPASVPGLSEDYELREYRPGDPLRTVHWKLSGKWDELIVRESTKSAMELPVLAVDRFGTPSQLDTVLDRMTGYCRAFLAAQRPHTVFWQNENGTPVIHLITDEKELRDCLIAMLSVPAPPRPPAAPGSDPPSSDPLLLIHVPSGEEAMP